MPRAVLGQAVRRRSWIPVIVRVEWDDGTTEDIGPTSDCGCTSAGCPGCGFELRTCG